MPTRAARRVGERPVPESSSASQDSIQFNVQKFPPHGFLIEFWSHDACGHHPQGSDFSPKDFALHDKDGLLPSERSGGVHA